MIVVRHRLSPLAWEFDANSGALQGSASTLQESVAAAEDAVRDHIASAGHPDLPRVRHDVEAAVLTA